MAGRVAEFLMHLGVQDDASETLTDVAETSEALDGKEANVAVGSEGAEETAETVAATGEAVDALDGTTATVTVEEQGAEETSTALTGLSEAAKFMGAAGLTGSAGMTKLAGAATAATAPIAAAAAAAKNSLDAYMTLASNTTKAAAAVGMTTEEYSRWVAVADDANVQSSALNQAFSKLNMEIAKGGPALAQFGIATKEASGDLRSTNDVMLDVVGVLATIEDPTERAVAGTQLLGRSYKNLAPLIGASEEEMRSYLDAVEQGQVITEKEAKSADEMRRAQDALQDSLMEVKLALGEMLVALEPVITTLAEVVGVVGEVIGPIADLTGGMKDLRGSLTDTIPFFGDLSDEVEGFGMGIVSGAIDGLKGLVSGTDEAGASAEAASETFATAAKNMVDSGLSAAEAAAALGEMGASSEQVTSAMDSAGVSGETLAAAQAEAAAQAKEAAAAEAQLTEQLNNEVSALQASAAEHELRTNAMRSAADAQFALTDSQAKFNDELGGMNEKLAAAGDDLVKQKQAYDDVAQSAGGLADATVRVWTEQAEANGQILTGKQQLDLWNSSMMQSAQKATPAASKAIRDYVYAVNQIPPAAITQIETLIEKGDFAEAEAQIKELSTNRRMTVSADADTADAESKIATLDAIAAGTVVDLPVTADTASASAQMVAFQEEVTGQPATVPVNANTAPAAGSIEGVEKGKYSATVVTGADTKPATREIDATETANYLASIGVDADTAAAASEILAFMTQTRFAPLFISFPNIGAAEERIQSLTTTQRLPIDAYLRDYPKSSDIVRAIGPVKVPVDATLRSTPRITGLRD